MDILNQMIKDPAKVKLSEYYGRMQVALSEPQQSRSSTEIYGLPRDAIVIKVDAFTSPDSVFAGTNGECKRGDYAIIADIGGKQVIIFIEMKATKGSTQDVIKQLKGARCFIAYCREIGKAFWREQDFLGKYQERFVSIGHTSIPKRRTRITPTSGKHDQPEKMLKIDWPHHLQFNQLAGA